MNALRVFDRKSDVRLAKPKDYIRQRTGEAAAQLNRAGRMAAQVELCNEALCRLTELVYVTENGTFCNVDTSTGQLRIPAPFGSSGWTFYGLRRAEGRCLRQVLWNRQRAWTSKDRPPLYTYDGDVRRWFVNLGDYGTLAAAMWWLQRTPITLAEWQQVGREIG